MSFTYKATTQAPLSVAQSEELGRYLGRYEIEITGLTVRHVLKDGQRVIDRPLADTVQMVASNTGIASALAPPTAGVMLALGIALPAISMTALLAGLVGCIKGYYEMGKRVPHPDALYSEVSFQLGNVSQQRLSWTEYLLSIYAARHDWRYERLQDARQSVLGAQYAATHAGYPTPWRESPGQRSAQQRKRQAQPSLWQHIKREIW